MSASPRRMRRSSSAGNSATKVTPNVPMRSSEPVELGLRSHFVESKRDATSKQRDPVTLWQITAFMACADAGYLVLFARYELYYCMAVALLALLGQLVTMALLWSNHVTSAKWSIVWNWFSSCCFVTVVLSSQSGMWVMAAPFGLVVIYLFEEVHPGNLAYCTAVTVTAVFLLLFMNTLCDWTDVLREPIGAARLAEINRVVQPSLAVTALLFILVITFYLKRQFLSREEGLQRERQLVERILHNLLPDQIVERLKQGENLIADLRPLVCVLFLDIVNFGALSSKLAPCELVQGLTRIVSQVDDVLKRFPRVQKIKTIGDAILVASGALDSEPNVENVAQVAQLALQLRDMKFELAYTDAKGRTARVPIQFRFGAHCGEVVAGVMSTERFVFDIIGDSVNVASRMEALSSPSRVLVSDHVRHVLRGSGGFGFVDNGVVEVKGKGRMQTWFVEHQQNS